MQQELKDIVRSAYLAACDSEDAPVDLAELGIAIRSIAPSFSPRQYGFDKLRPLLESLSDVLDVVKDDSIHPPRFFARPADAKAAAGSPVQPPEQQSSRTVRAKLDENLYDFAFLPKQRFAELAALAIPERWSFGVQASEADEFSLLRNFVKYTFARLVFEKKVSYSADGQWAAFNTGLVDNRYEQIFALFSRNHVPGRQDWHLDRFCIAGEDFFGKQLVKSFCPLPEPAYYFSDVRDVIYDINAGAPIVDWHHVIVENVDRIPLQVVRRTPVSGFEFQDCSDMSDDALEAYKSAFADAISADRAGYKSIKDRFVAALELALKRVRWNFRTAVPIYFPRERKVSLLLPLSLISESKTDLALVVQRTESGNYLGQTIYPLEWAYANARLVSRPESDWLAATQIEVAETAAASVEQAA
ncbi:DUF3825 domain-containing protein [Paraburkholderia hospita]|uniref:DUF3825 domain-containing protein n=1 Tax=Paraburkholderia hospita TaxID=169430 RepID=A0AAN1J423_9BURK|nr:DUF3825 domain-containing protein [Paraburkholderia hospita]AUT67041.1 DUF3825 domain-containing protein [Paraburkholderia hospita]SEH41097.1 OST-HTH/LOTUS domain-containing protein [Paraburkholderia hospita]